MMERKIRFMVVIFIATIFFAGCKSKEAVKNDDRVKLLTLDPGHFHAALVQKSMYANVDSSVHVYAPDGPDLKLHLARIEQYNSRQENPTQWNEIIYTGADFFEKMTADKQGNVVVLSGNNQKKTEYISESLKAGFNVLADKPMAINVVDFELLKSAFATAKEKNVLLYDIMTERFEITTILQKEFSILPKVFGSLEKGSEQDPAVTKESVHYFYKYVSGNILTRPPWFMDVKQQGEGVVDVTTHLVDLVQWECFPEQILDYKKDISVLSARHWPTDMTLGEFKAITKLVEFPEYLKGRLKIDTVLSIFCNGEINYRIRDVHAKVSVKWDYKAPEGSGDSHYSIMRGSKANLVIRQTPETKNLTTLFIEPVNDGTDFKNVLMEEFKLVAAKYPGIELRESANGWEVIVPEKYREGHEAHFARVMEKYLDYLRNGNMPEWEVPNMIAKYYTTTQGLEKASK